MPLKDRLQSDLTAAMRARDEVARATLRMALAAIAKAEVAGRSHTTLTDDQVVELLRSEVRRRREAAEIYEGAGRAELAARERAEAEVLRPYLPVELDDAALDAIVAEEVAKAGVTGPAATGRLIKAVRERVGSRAQGSRVAEAVKRALAPS